MKSAIQSVLVCSLLVALIGCGGNNSNYTPPPPPVSITMSATTASVQTTGYNDANANTFQFTATVQHATDTSIKWDVNGQPAGTSDIGYGTISSAGLYTAPMMIPNGSIQVHAIANADTTKTATAAITLVWSAQLYNLQVASSVETSSSTPIQLFFDTNGPKDLTWAVNGSEMGTATGGAIGLDYTRMSGNYIAPAAVPASPVHVTATLKSNGKSLSKDITITGNSNASDPTITVTPSAITLEPGATQSFAVAVTNNGNPVAGGVSWSAGTYGGGSFGHLLTDGVIKSNGTYTAPYDPPDNRAVVVTAYYGSASVPKTGYAVITLSDPAVDPNLRLNGQFAFSLHDSQYQSTAFGILTADGHGRLSGTMDVLTSLGSVTGQPFTGTYTAHADGRVEATISYAGTPVQTITQPISLMLVSDTRAYAVSSGPMGMLTGTVEKQDPTAFDRATVQGDYGFLVQGASYAFANQNQLVNPYAGGGLLTLNSDGTTFQIATWDDGAARDDVAMTGSYSYDNTTGFGTLTMPTTSGPTYNFHFAVVSSKKILLASADDVSGSLSGEILEGWAERRAVSPPLNPANLSGPFAFYLLGQQWLEVGHFSTDGAGGITHGLLDMRDTSLSASIPSLKWDLFDGAYSIDASGAPYNRGRLHFASSGTQTNPSMQQYATFYMISPDRLIILMDSMPTAVAGEAFQESLSTGVPDDNRYAVHFVGPDLNNYGTGWTMPLDLVTATPWLGWRDTNGSTKQEWELIPAAPQLNDVYTFNVLMTNGMAFPNVRAYAISPSKLMLIGLDMGYSGANEFIWMEELQGSGSVDPAAYFHK